MAGTKGLFQTLSPNESVVQALSQMSDKLRNMSIGRNGMALAMIRIQGNKLSYSSAGIPPMLLYRNRTNEVQEILVEGLPLGLKSAGKYYARNLRVIRGRYCFAHDRRTSRTIGSR